MQAQVRLYRRHRFSDIVAGGDSDGGYEDLGLAVLTDEHATASPGLPVVLIAGYPYSPDDLGPSVELLVLGVEEPWPAEAQDFDPVNFFDSAYGREAVRRTDLLREWQDAARRAGYRQYLDAR